ELRNDRRTAPRFPGSFPAMIAVRRDRALGPVLAGLLAALLRCESAPPEAPLSPPTSRSAEVQSALAEAAEAYQRGDLLRAADSLGRAAAGAPDDSDIALDLGDTLNR